MTYSSPDPSDERPVPPPLGTVMEAGSPADADADRTVDTDGSDEFRTLDERVARPDVADAVADDGGPDAGGDG